MITAQDPMTRLAGRLARDTRAMSAVEFAMSLPILITLIAGGTELANYALISTRVSQLAIQVADNASRIGAGDPLTTKTISESMINDVLTGAGIHAGTMNIYGTYDESGTTKPAGRIIISQLEPAAVPNTTNKYKIAWQRCRGQAITYTPQYGRAGQPSGINMDGMGPAGRQVTSIDDSPVMYVEVHYRYKPLWLNSYGREGFQDINAVAAMMTRDPRVMGTPTNTEGAPLANCQ